MKVLVLYGPTVTGKTNLAIDLAKKFDGEIISADSRQIYKGLDIGTGKVDFKSDAIKHKGFWVANGIKINGFDIVNPGQNFTAADFIRFARKKISAIKENQKIPIVVGGTGFYLKSLFEGLDTIGIIGDSELRHKLERLSVSALLYK